MNSYKPAGTDSSTNSTTTPETPPPSGVLALIALLDVVLRRMISGVVRFMFSRLPNWALETLRRLGRWLVRVAKFICYTLPEHFWRAFDYVLARLQRAFQRLFSWLHASLQFLGKLSYKLVRLFALLVVWDLLVAGPLALSLTHSASIRWILGTLLWAVLAVVGSSWGLRRAARKEGRGIVIPTKWVCAMATLGVVVLTLFMW